MQRYGVIKRIGKGSFGTVDLIRRKKDDKSFVLKRMKIGSVSSKERDMCHNEVHLLERLNHPSIVRYEESFVDTKHSETYLCVVMAYCDGGDLTHFLKNQRGKKLREKHVLDLFVQIALAMHFVHKRNILHRDLKAQNIFVKDGQLKLGDFGISKVLTGSVAFAQTMIGTPYYMSPEVFKGKPYNFKSDIWSLGCVLYEMMTFKHCFDANNLNSLAQKIVRGKYVPISGRQYRNDMKLLCYSMLSQVPSSRPTLEDILRNKLLANRIRDFYISCYKKHLKSIIPQSTFNNLKNQLYEIGLHHILDNIDDIAKQQTIKKEQQKKLREEHKKIEKEKKIQKDMELALEKLKHERKWRIAQKKHRHKIYKQENKLIRPKQRPRNRSLSDQHNIADKRRKAAKNRKLQILKQQEQKRQELAAKHRNKQERAAQKKSYELEIKRKTPRSQRSPSYIRSPKRFKSKLKHSSQKKPKEEEQVEQLNIWENAHINVRKRNISSNLKQQRKSIAKENNLLFDHKASLPSKSPLSLVKQKIKYQKEYDALDALKKRRELIQRRLYEISERHKERQLKKQIRTNNNAYYHNQAQSEQPYISNSNQSKTNQNTVNKSKSQQQTPYKKPPQMRDNMKLYPSPNKYNIKPNNATSNGPTLSPSPSPLRFAGVNVMNWEQSSKSPSPAPESDINMNPRERMEARKRERADLRAQQIRNANKVVFKNNQLIAQQNKKNNTSRRIPRAVSEQVLDQILTNDDISSISGDCTQSEPPIINDVPGVIVTIKETEEPEDEEDDGIEDEIDELKHTLIQHTLQIEEIKKTILMKRKEQLSESDNDNDEENDVDDVETLLNKQENNMKTMRILIQNTTNDNENKAQNNYNANCKEVNPLSGIEMEECESDESSEEMPIGRLVERIEFIKRKCIDGMGLDGFKIAYNLMKQLQSQDKEDLVDIIDNKIKNLCCNPNVSKYRVQKYRSLIDQLLFIEANCS